MIPILPMLKNLNKLKLSRRQLCSLIARGVKDIAKDENLPGLSEMLLCAMRVDPSIIPELEKLGMLILKTVEVAKYGGEASNEAQPNEVNEPQGNNR